MGRSVFRIPQQIPTKRCQVKPNRKACLLVIQVEAKSMRLLGGSTPPGPRIPVISGIVTSLGSGIPIYHWNPGWLVDPMYIWLFLDEFQWHHVDVDLKSSLASEFACISAKFRLVKTYIKNTRTRNPLGSKQENTSFTISTAIFISTDRCFFPLRGTWWSNRGIVLEKASGYKGCPNKRILVTSEH